MPRQNMNQMPRAAASGRIPDERQPPAPAQLSSSMAASALSEASYASFTSSRHQPDLQPPSLPGASLVMPEFEFGVLLRKQRLLDGRDSMELMAAPSMDNPFRFAADTWLCVSTRLHR